MSRFEDDVLLSFGLRVVLLPAVRAVRTPEELLALNKHLPAECAETLTWLAEGIPSEEIRTAAAQPKVEKVDTTSSSAVLPAGEKAHACRPPERRLVQPALQRMLKSGIVEKN